MSVLAMPGDAIDIKRKESRQIVIGPGLRKDNQDSIVASKCGVLRKKENNSFYWIESHQKRYVPARNDYVIGVVANKSAETFKVDIGGSEQASLSCLAFENATKRNRPNVDIGDLVYCRVLTGSKDMEPELVCIDSAGKASGLGVLKDGFMFKVNLELSRRLLSNSNQLLRSLGKQLAPFEITVGMNGRVWLKATTSKQVILLVDIIKAYANVVATDDESTNQFVAEFLSTHPMAN